MQMKRVFIFIACYLAALNAIRSKAEDQSGPITDLVTLKSGNVGGHREVINSFYRQRMQLISNLVEVLNGNYSLESKLASARVLGNMRATEAVDVLTKNLELERQERQLMGGLVSDSERNEMLRPISTALQKIGPPDVISTMESSTISGASPRPLLVSGLSSFGKLTQKEDEAFVREFNASFRTEQSLLIEQLSTGSNDVKCVAAYLLGVMRSKTAIDALARNIDLRDTSDRQIQKEWYWSHYPAAQSLMEIGHDSLPAMFRNLESSDIPLVRELSLKVIRHVEKDRAILKLRFQQAIDAQSDAEKRSRLQAALGSF
jgi:hypothetical protein